MLAYLFVLLAVAYRFLPHPMMFTPVAASLLFFGARGSRKMAWVPVVLLAASDVILTKFVYGYPIPWDHAVSWVWYAAMIWLGATMLRRNINVVRVFGAGLAAAVSFFLVSNFAVWAAWTNMYPRTLSGLEAAYIAGLPFLRNDVAGNLFFTAVMFSIPALAQVFSHAREKRASLPS